jgi:hypothetical protein
LTGEPEGDKNMRRPLAMETLRHFTAGLKQILPQFERSKEFLLPKVCFVFVRKAAPKLWLFVVLQFYENEDEFTVEIAWSQRQRMPEDCMVSVNEKPRNGDWNMRLCRFWVDEGIWWELAPRETLEEMVEKMEAGRFFDEYPLEKARKKIKPQVQDAIAGIRKHAIPYFRRICEQCGVQWAEPIDINPKKATRSNTTRKKS